MEPGDVVPFESASPLAAGEIRRRASAGLVVVGMRGIAISVLGLASNVVLARLLTPRDFGIAAAGLTFIAFVGLLSDGGLGGGLIRRHEPPTRNELRALLGLQLIVTGVMAVVIGVVAFQFGEAGHVVTLMVCAMPVVAFQFPGKIQLERRLNYRPLAFIEVSQVLVYQAVAIALVVLGAGVWGLAWGWFARALTGAVITNLLSPMRVLRPSLAWQRIRSLISFGMKLQFVTLTALLRDQGLNVVVGTVGGVSTLGLYSLAKRLLEVPYLVLTTLLRISMPAMSQLLVVKEEPGPLIARALSAASVGTGIGLVMLGGSSPGLVPSIFGGHWAESAQILPGACLGLYVVGSIAVATQGYLYAVGDASAVLRATVASAAVVLIAAAALLPVVDTWAVGIGLLLGALCEATLLTRYVNRHTAIDVLSIMWVPALIAAVAIIAGWWSANMIGPTFAAGLVGAAISLGLFLGPIALLRPAQIPAFIRLVRRAIRNARTTSAESAA
jgi:O-antigen/teichoic acid export membrane protein